MSALDPSDSKAAVSALRKLQEIYGNEGSIFSSHPALDARADALKRALYRNCEV